MKIFSKKSSYALLLAILFASSTSFAFAQSRPPIISSPGTPNGNTIILSDGRVIHTPTISSPGVTINTRQDTVEILPPPHVATTSTTMVAPPITAYAMTVRSEPTLSSNAMLTINNRFENICPTDILNYTVSYKNISGSTLTNVVLTVTIPEQFNFDKASSGTYNPGDHTLVVPIGVLSPGQEGIIYVDVTAAGGVLDYDLITTKAELVFTTPTGSQDNAVAFAFNDGKACPRNNLAALAFLSGSFFPHSFLGWFLLILLILGVVFIARKLYAKENPHGVHVHH